MTGVMVMQGRELRAADIDLIQGLLAEHPDWGRTRLSEALCRRWDWRNAQGRFKDVAASSDCRGASDLRPTGCGTARRPWWLMRPNRSVTRWATYDR